MKWNVHGMASTDHRPGTRTEDLVRRCSVAALLAPLLTSLLLALLATGAGTPTSANAAPAPQVTLLLTPFAPEDRAIPLSGRVSGVTKPHAKVARLQTVRNKKWATVAKDRLDKKGNYSFTRTHEKAGTFRYRVRVYAGSKRIRTSPTRVVRIGAIPYPKSNRSIRPSARRSESVQADLASATGASFGYFRCSEQQRYAQLDHPFITGTGYSWWYSVLVEGNDRHTAAAGRWMVYDPASYTWYDFATYSPSSGTVWSNIGQGIYYGYNYAYANRGNNTYDVIQGYSPSIGGGQSCIIF